MSTPAAIQGHRGVCRETRRQSSHVADRGDRRRTGAGNASQVALTAGISWALFRSHIGPVSHGDAGMLARADASLIPSPAIADMSLLAEIFHERSLSAGLTSLRATSSIPRRWRVTVVKPSQSPSPRLARRRLAELPGAGTMGSGNRQQSRSRHHAQDGSRWRTLAELFGAQCKFETIPARPLCHQRHVTKCQA